VIRSFKDLIAWQKSMELVTAIYRVTRTFPKDETYGLTSQIRRAAISVPSNIAEGQARLTKGEFLHSLGQSRGSLAEVETQLTVALNLDYVHADLARPLVGQIAETGRVINGLIASLRRRSDN